METENMTEEEYNALHGYRSTSFKEIFEYGLYDHILPAPRKERAAFTFGNLLHTMVLEPEELKKRYAPMFESDLNKNTNKYKELKKEFEAENAGKIIVSREDYDKAVTMREVVMNRYGNIIETSKREIVFQHETEDGIKLKVKMDCINEKYGLIFDLKSTGDELNRNNVQWNCQKYNYDLQAAFYESVAKGAGANVEQFAFLFSSSNDYRALMYKADGFFMERGRAKFGEVYEKVLAYHEKGMEAVSDAVLDLSVPARILNREMGEF
jgi:hypothetical protein